MEFSSTSKPFIASNISPESLQKYTEEISTLPKETGWSSMMILRSYQHFWFYPFLLKGAMHAQHHFQAQPTHIFLCSPMKTGCTWLKALSVSIVTRTLFDDSNNPIRNAVPHDCIPMLEFGENYSFAEGHRIPLFASHLPYTCLPKSVIDSGCKIVYLCRDPKDTFISMWHFFGKMVENNKTGEARFVSIEEAFELFCKGVSSYGPYWDHVLGYWKASLENPERILFLKYEDMKEDTELCVKKLAEFFGCPFSLQEEGEGKIQGIVELCSFESLSNLKINKSGKHVKKDGFMENSAYFRKGEIGDWRNYLSAEMGERLDKIVEEKLSGSGFTFLHNHNS